MLPSLNTGHMQVSELQEQILDLEGRLLQEEIKVCHEQSPALLRRLRGLCQYSPATR